MNCCPGLADTASLVLTNDLDFSAILAARGIGPLASGPIESLVADLPYAATETILNERGIERITKCPLGQFSAILPLLLPDKGPPTVTTPPTR